MCCAIFVISGTCADPELHPRSRPLRPSYADHIMTLFSSQGLSVQVIQWTNELQTALALVATGLGITRRRSGSA